MGDNKPLSTAKSKAEIVRTIVGVLQLTIAIATLLILIFVHIV